MSIDAFDQLVTELESTKSDVWPDRIPLPRSLPLAPRMTQACLYEDVPKVIADWVMDIANRTQVPIESVLVCAIGTLASLVGRKIGIYPKSKDQWWVPCVFWTCYVARPGERKSTTMTQAQKPLTRLEKRAASKSRASRAEINSKLETQKILIENAKADLKKALKTNSANVALIQERLTALLLENESLTPATIRYRTSDATIEAIAILLQSNPAGILVARDELKGFLSSFEKSGYEGARSFFLEGWDATGSPYTCDRVTREGVEVQAICIQVMGTIQPGSLEFFLRQATSEGGGDDGLIQRFQLLVYPELNTDVKWVDELPDASVLARVDKVCDSLVSIPSPEADKNPLGLRFDHEAQECYKIWSVNLETRFRSGDENPSFISHLSKYLRLYPALALLFTLVESADENRQPISVNMKNAKRAESLCRFLEAHARKVYAIVEKREMRDAEVLKRKIENRSITDGMTIREIAEKDWSPFKRDVKAITYAIDSILAPNGWARTETKTSAHGGRPSTVIRIHPDLRSANVNL